MCVLLRVFREFPDDPYHEPLAWLAWFMIPYNAYQVKTVICRQLIQAPLKYFDNYFNAGIASHFYIIIIIIIIITSTSDLQPSTAIANQLPGH